MIGVITYDAPHRKTQDLVTQLMLNGYSEIHLIAIPWVARRRFEPIFNHRPSGCVNITAHELAQRLKLPFSRVDAEGLNHFFSSRPFRHILVAGAGILPNELALNHKIVNTHPGYLPNVKGLDAFKWAIYNGQPIGVTTHYISDKVDEGELIERRIIPVYFEDSFHNVAYRVYEAEIDMLVNSISLIEGNHAKCESLADGRYAANRRMPQNYELVMMSRFEEIRKKSGSYRSQ